MQGLVFEGGRRVALHTFAYPTPQAGEVVLRVTASGMCGSDLHYYRADPAGRGAAGADPGAGGPCVGGHEPAGIVAELGPGVDGRTLGVGDRVMVHHYAGCGSCASCRSGWTQMCSTAPARVYGKNAHGAHAPFMKVAAASVLPLPDALSFEAGAAVGCGTGTAWGGLERLGDVGGRDLVVLGQGPVGLSATLLAAARGARVIAVDPVAGRREQALALGAADTVDPSAADPAEAVRDLTGGTGAPLVLETSGTSAAADTALEALAPWGRLCVVGLGGTVRLDVRAHLSRQVTVMTSWSMSSVQQMACAAFVARRGLPVDALFSHRWTLDRASEAYTAFDAQTSGKGVFVF